MISSAPLALGPSIQHFNPQNNHNNDSLLTMGEYYLNFNCTLKNYLNSTDDPVDGKEVMARHYEGLLKEMDKKNPMQLW